MIDRLKTIARRLRAETHALYLAARDPRTPWYARALIVGVVAYALSPIDFIPDFIPVLGYLDDLVLLPLGVALAIRLVPAEVLNECRARAGDMTTPGTRSSRIAAVVVVAIWIALALLAIAWVVQIRQ